MNDETKEKLKKGSYFALCIIGLGLLCAFPFISKSCSSENVIKNVDKNFAKLNGDGISTETPSSTYTISSNYNFIADNSYALSSIYFDENQQTPIFNNDYDFFGLGVNNYFRFSAKNEYATKLPNNNSCYALEFYIDYGDNIGIYPLAYFDIYEDSDDTGTFIAYYPIGYKTFQDNGISVNYYAINLNYYNKNKLDQFIYIVNNEILGELFYYSNYYELPTNYFSITKVNKTNFNFVKVSQDLENIGYQSGYNVGYNTGYNDGYNIGMSDASANDNVFTILKKAVSSISTLLSIEVLPGISLWLLLSIPLAISIMIIMFKLLRGDN